MVTGSSEAGVAQLARNTTMTRRMAASTAIRMPGPSTQLYMPNTQFFGHSANRWCLGTRGQNRWAVRCASGHEIIRYDARVGRRWLAVSLMLVGCRLHFDPLGGPGGGDDGPGGGSNMQVATGGGYTTGNHTYGKASNTDAFDDFGYHVVISADGLTL